MLKYRGSLGCWNGNRLWQVLKVCIWQYYRKTPLKVYIKFECSKWFRIKYLYEIQPVALVRSYFPSASVCNPELQIDAPLCAACDLGSNIYMRYSMLPWFEVISQAPVFATPELQIDAPKSTLLYRLYRVLQTGNSNVWTQNVHLSF